MSSRILIRLQLTALTISYIFLPLHLIVASATVTAIDSSASSSSSNSSSSSSAATERSVDYEIRTLSGEPNYKSVHLTWEIETLPTNNNKTSSIAKTMPPPKTFAIFYCELQNFGPHRCRSKVIEDNEIEQNQESLKQYSTTIDNLRMATKYSFHIKSLPKKKLQKITGRSSDQNQENEIQQQTDSLFNEQTIIIPTKGFSAQATKCLPHASEIEVETGPYFGGKIVVDGGNCGIKGNPKDSMDKYIMRIDHAKCGSTVRPETNTVETFITVQENLGIFTHSTRRFVVVCSFQSGMQTVRASFTVPGKGGAAIVSDDEFELGRSGRGREFRMVDKSALILKESHSSENVKNEENEKDSPNSVSIIEDVITEESSENITKNTTKFSMESNAIDRPSKYAKYSMLIDGSYEVDEIITPNAADSRNNYTGLMIVASLSLIMIGIGVYIIQREIKRYKAIRLPKRQIMHNLGV